MSDATSNSKLLEMYMLEGADPNPPPGAPYNFPVGKVSPTGLRLFYAPPYSRQDPDEPLVRGIGVKIRKPTTWIDHNSQQQTWDDDWEKRYPSWDCSKAGLFDLFDTAEIHKLTYVFEWKLPGDDEPIETVSVPLKYPGFGMPLKSKVPLDMAKWARSMVAKTEGLFNHPRLSGLYLTDALVIPARLFNECQPGTVNESDFGLVGDKVTIRLPKLRPDCAMTLKRFQNAGYYVPCANSLYGRTEKSIGFEYRTQLLGAQLGTATVVDPDHKVENVKFENLWFVMLQNSELPTYHFWTKSEDVRFSDGFHWPLLTVQSRTLPINRPGDIRRTGAIHEPVVPFTNILRHPAAEQLAVPPVQSVAKASVPQPQEAPAVSTAMEDVTVHDYAAPSQRQDSVFAQPPVRYQKATRVILDPTFQPSPTTDLFSHSMLTRRQANKEPTREESISPVEKRRLVAKARARLRARYKSQKAATMPAQSPGSADEAPQVPASAPSARSASPEAEPEPTPTPHQPIESPVLSPRRTRSGLARDSTQKTTPAKRTTKAPATKVAKPAPKSKAPKPKAQPQPKPKPARKRKADAMSTAEPKPRATRATRATRSRSAADTTQQENLGRGKRVRTKSLKALEIEQGHAL